jgi:hypothetical protein
LLHLDLMPLSGLGLGHDLGHQVPTQPHLPGGRRRVPAPPSG